MHSQSASSIAGEKETEGTVVVEMLINARIHMASQRLHILQVSSSDYVLRFMQEKTPKIALETFCRALREK